MKLSKHDDSVLSFVSRDNTNLISASLDRLLTHWDLETKQAVKTYRGHSPGVSSVCILKSGEMVTAGHDQSVRVWHGETGALVHSLNQHSKPVNSIAVCPVATGKPMVATAAEDRTMRFWQPTIGRMTARVADASSMIYCRASTESMKVLFVTRMDMSIHDVHAMIRSATARGKAHVIRRQPRASTGPRGRCLTRRGCEWPSPRWHYFRLSG